jgi:hypothetical protein
MDQNPQKSRRIEESKILSGLCVRGWSRDIPPSYLNATFPGVTWARESEIGRGTPIFDLYHRQFGGISVKLSKEKKRPVHCGSLTTGTDDHMMAFISGLAGLDVSMNNEPDETGFVIPGNAGETLPAFSFWKNPEGTWEALHVSIREVYLAINGEISERDDKEIAQRAMSVKKVARKGTDNLYNEIRWHYSRDNKKPWEVCPNIEFRPIDTMIWVEAILRAYYL